MLIGNYGTDSELYPMDRVQRALYEASSRIIWSAAMSFIIYACVTNGGFVNRILSWPGWLPLSKLSFCAYLIQDLIHKSFRLSEHHVYGQLDWSNFVSFNFRYTYTYTKYFCILILYKFRKISRF